jgi:Phage integrase family
MIDCERRFELRAWRTSSRSMSEWPPPKTPNDCGSSAHRPFSSTAAIHSPMEAHLVSAAASIRHSMAWPVHLRLSSYAKHSAVSDPHGTRGCQKLLPRLGRSYFGVPGSDPRRVFGEYLATVRRSGLVFPEPARGPLRVTSWNRRTFTPSATSVGLIPPTLRVHDLRHAAASLMIASGASVKIVQQQLGHASATLTGGNGCGAGRT